jgi:hypothetical protein
VGEAAQVKECDLIAEIGREGDTGGSVGRREHACDLLDGESSAAAEGLVARDSAHQFAEP